MSQFLRPILPFDTGWPAGSYMPPSHVTGMSSSVLSTSALETVVPFILPRAVSLVSIGFPLVTHQTGAECRVGLYTHVNGPSALIVDGGTIDLSSGGGTIKEATLSLTLGPGMVWACCQMKNVGTQVTAIRVANVRGGIIPCTSAQILAATMARCLSRSITYGSALLSTASGSLAPDEGNNCPVLLLETA